jgi:hypothetical protein
MSSQDSLLGFLKKKSLFSQSPVRYPVGMGKRSRSKSKDKDSIIKRINSKDFEQDLSPVDKFYTNNNSSQELKRENLPFRNLA